eukprot:Nitzschia sp. Nitz4//scaffold47_size129522//41315//42676//NITZ4_003545-RA/size129522-snap-gene-0.195-mRNA-1//-1//CDS//3329552782//1296//frame0
MGFGIKRLFKKKKEKKTPVAGGAKANAKATPATKPIDEATAEKNAMTEKYSTELPVKNLLEELNVCAPTAEGETELVIGEQPVAETESNDAPFDEPPPEPAPEDEATTEIPETTEDDKQSEPVIPSEEPQTTPEKSPAKEVAATTTETPKTENLTSTKDDTVVSETAESKPAVMETPTVARKLFQMFETATRCTTGGAMNEPVTLVVPTADNDLCQAIGKTRSDLTAPKIQRQYSYYDSKFALKFLDELMNVGYALVNHEQLVDDNTDEADWIGRSVTLILRPGICNAIQVQVPCLEWSTMGGGQQTRIETHAVSLLDVHSIATSDVSDAVDADEDEQDTEEVQCLFTLTTKQGNVHVMEAITADESQRIVAGIKNLSLRLSRQIIMGDNAVLSDFFDNSQEPDEIRLTAQEAMFRLSHALLDGQAQ